MLSLFLSLSHTHTYSLTHSWYVRPWQRIPWHSSFRGSIKRLKHFVFAITRRVIGWIDTAKITVIEGLIYEVRQMDNLCYSRLFSSPRVSGSSARPGIDLSVHASSSPWSACCSAIGELFRLWDTFIATPSDFDRISFWECDLWEFDSFIEANERERKFKINDNLINGCFQDLTMVDLQN